jgi:hypothetical protein
MIDQMYQDSMDPTRLVKPVARRGTEVMCRVYWKRRAEDKGHSALFGGFSTIPVSLFDCPGAHSFGFTPVVP